MTRSRIRAGIIAGFCMTAQACAAESLNQSAQTFYTHFFVSGGPIVWFVELPMSIAALYLILDLSIRLRRSRLLPCGIAAEIATAAARYGVQSLPSRFGKRHDFVSLAICVAVSKTAGLRSDWHHTSQIAAESIQEKAFALTRRAEWCNLLGNVAPMVGLFGTVYGMIEAFNILGISSGQPKSESLALAISVALVTTFWGLLIAIPSLFFHGVFRSRVESLASEAAVETESLLEKFSRFPLTSAADASPVPLDDITAAKQKIRDRRIISAEKVR